MVPGAAAGAGRLLGSATRGGSCIADVFGVIGRRDPKSRRLSLEGMPGIAGWTPANLLLKCGDRAFSQRSETASSGQSRGTDDRPVPFPKLTGAFQRPWSPGPRIACPPPSSLLGGYGYWERRPSGMSHTCSCLVSRPTTLAGAGAAGAAVKHLGNGRAGHCGTRHRNRRTGPLGSGC